VATKTKCTRCGRAIEVKLITRCDWCDGKVIVLAPIPIKTWPPTLERK
jgi:DNA-directed RNA polymerase subunit RPC12/RpoP